MTRIKWVDERLEQWAKWIMHGSSGGSGGAMFDPNRVDQTADVRAGMRRADPHFSPEVSLTDQAVAALPTDLRRTVIEVYTGEGRLEDIAGQMRITTRTLRNRLCNADRRIDAWFEARRERAEQIRCNLNYATFR